MISGYGCYIKYLALKSHFQNDAYDYIKYNGSVRANEQTFQKRNDRFFFEKLAKKLKSSDDVERFFVANFVEINKIWIGDILDEACHDTYIKWKGKLESIGYKFEMDLGKIIEANQGGNFATSFKVTNGQHPVVLKMLLRGDINIESIILLNVIVYNFIGDWDRDISDNVIYPEIRRKIMKYSILLDKYLKVEQKKKMKEFVKKALTNS